MMIRENIVDGVISALSTIKTDSGYNSNIGQNAYDWDKLDMPLDEDFESSVFVLDPSTEHDNEMYGAQKQSVKLLIKIIASSKESKSRTVRRMIGDVYRAVGENLENLYKIGVQKVLPESTEMDIDSGSLLVMGASITINIEFITSLWLQGGDY